MWCQIISSSSQTAISPCDNYRPVTIFCPCPEVVIISDILCSGLDLSKQPDFSCYWLSLMWTESIFRQQTDHPYFEPPPPPQPLNLQSEIVMSAPAPNRESYERRYQGLFNLRLVMGIYRTKTGQNPVKKFYRFTGQALLVWTKNVWPKWHFRPQKGKLG